MISILRSYVTAFFSGAGDSSQHRYDELARRWRRRVLPPIRLAVLVTSLPLLVGAVLVHELGGWFLGLFTGALLGIYLWLRDSPPEHIENWRIGAEGERNTARELAPLTKAGWRVLHDLPSSYCSERSSDRAAANRCELEPDDENEGNVDHVLIGPRGVFLLDSKWLGGEASIEGDAIRVTRRDDPSNSYLADRVASRLRGQAASLKADIDAAGIRLFVRAAVVMWNPFDAGVVEGDRVTFLAGSQLLGWLDAFEPVVPPQMVERIAAAIVRARPRARRAWWRRLLPGQKAEGST